MKAKWILLPILLLMISCTAQQITVYIIGDSTMANKPNPEENP